MTMKKGDFIQVEYIGKVKDGEVFDTTSEAKAKEAGIHTHKTAYGPITICLGEGHILKGLEEQLLDKKEGTYTIQLTQDQAFGKRQGKLIQLVPTKKLEQNNIKPYPGLQLNMDGMIAIVKTVSGGRTVIDFNHPLAGKEVEYEVTINKKVDDPVDQAKAVLSLELQIKPEVEEKDGKLLIKGLPEQAHEPIKKRIKELVKKEVVFDNEKEGKLEKEINSSKEEDVKVASESKKE